MQKKTQGWPLILALCLSLFPLGIWLMYQKVSVEKGRRVTNGRIVRNFGFVLLCMVGFLFLAPYTGMLSEETAALMTTQAIGGAAIMAVGGLLAIGFGVRLIHKGKLYAHYIAAIRKRTDTDIAVADIAAAVSAPRENAVRVLQEMIDEGFLPDAYLDVKSGKLRLPQEPDVPTRSVFCERCGAHNPVPIGQAAMCAYCGQALL